MQIAFLGLGVMGSAVARHLVAAGYELRVWNRTASAAKPLTERGALASPTAEAAVKTAQLVFTMVHDDAAMSAVLFDGGVLDAMAPGAIHISLSTISVSLARQLAREHASRGQKYIGCPVFGRPGSAAEGKLWLAVAGPDETVQEVLPVLSTFSRGFTVVGGEPHTAHALKLGGNFLIGATIAALSEAFIFAEAQGIEPDVFLEAVNNALFQSPFYASYGKVMLHPPEKVNAAVSLGIKDTRLFREAGEEANVATPLADHFAEVLDAAEAEGRGKEDWAAGYLQQVRVHNQKGEQAV